MNPPSNIVDIYKSQGWNDEAAIRGDIAAGGWKSKVPNSGGGASGGSSAPTAPSIQEFSDKAYAPADEALKQYVMALRGQRQPLDVYGELEQAAGLPGMKATAATLREQIGNLEDTIKRVEPNVNATTKESYVTEAQRAGMIEARQKPLIENLGTLTTGLGRISEGISAASADLGTRMQLYLQGQEQALKPLEIQLAAASEKAARQVTGFTADVQNKLTSLMAEWNRNNELDDQKTEQAFQALQSEKSYAQELAKMVEQSKLNVSEYQQKKVIDNKSTGTSGGSAKYYDPNAGKSSTTGLKSPPMSAPVGTVTEYPAGSGIYWTSTGNGWN